MDYKESWLELKTWLETSIKTMSERDKYANGRVHHTIRSKMGGMKATLEKINRIENGKGKAKIN